MKFVCDISHRISDRLSASIQTIKIKAIFWSLLLIVIYVSFTKPIRLHSRITLLFSFWWSISSLSIHTVSRWLCHCLTCQHRESSIAPWCPIWGSAKLGNKAITLARWRALEKGNILSSTFFLLLFFMVMIFAFRGHSLVTLIKPLSYPSLLSQFIFYFWNWEKYFLTEDITFFFFFNFEGIIVVADDVMHSQGKEKDWTVKNPAQSVKKIQTFLCNDVFELFKKHI